MRMPGKVHQAACGLAIGSFCLELIVGCTGGGPWRAPELKGTPLLDEFQSACVATDADPGKVEAVAEAMGAKLASHSSTDTPMRMSVETWTHSRDGADTRIDTAFVESPAEGGSPAVIMTKCEVRIGSKDTVSAGVISKWLGSAITNQSDCSFPGCAYREVNGQRTPIDNDAEYIGAQNAGELRQLIYVHEEGETELELDRSRSVPSGPARRS